jgi:hypothetical protein
MNNMRDNTKYSPQHPLQVEDGLDFILSHFQEPMFPRKIMTKDLGYQVEVFNREEALEYFKSSNYKDCRINAYPSFTEYQGINRTPISFLMVDLDLKDFGGQLEEEGEDSKKKKGKILLEKALNIALDKIKKESIEEAQANQSEPSIWERGIADARTILYYLSKDKNVLEVIRNGQPGSTSTTYQINPPLD